MFVINISCFSIIYFLPQIQGGGGGRYLASPPWKKIILLSFDADPI
jgi:hypothetical protein